MQDEQVDLEIGDAVGHIAASRIVDDVFVKVTDAEPDLETGETVHQPAAMKILDNISAKVSEKLTNSGNF